MLSLPGDLNPDWKSLQGTNTLAYFGCDEEKDVYMRLMPGANVIKLFTTVIYYHSMVTASFCVTKVNNLGN
jgi:hypothetical protein